MTFEIIGSARSRSFRVLWLAEELGIEYTHLPEPPRSALVSELNPLGQIPVARDGETVMTDSLALLYHLSDREGRFTYPPGSPERARMDARINFILTEMEAPVWMATRHSFVLPEERRRPEIKPLLRADFKDADARFLSLLGDAEFFGGDDFTIADILAAHTIGWSLNAKFEASPDLMAYFERPSARPAWTRARAL